MDNRVKDIGKRIRQVRKEHNLSQIQLSEISGISVPYLSDIENGKVCCSITILLDLAKALQISTDWILRAEIPNTTEIHTNEAAKIFSDCSPSETESLLHILVETKNMLRKTKNEDF